MSVTFFNSRDPDNGLNAANANARVLLTAAGVDSEFLDGSAEGEVLRRMLQCLTITVNSRLGKEMVQEVNQERQETQERLNAELDAGARIVLCPISNDYLIRRGRELMQLMHSALEADAMLIWG